MENLYLVADLIYGLLFAGAIGMTALTSRELLAARLMVIVAAFLMAARWGIWAVMTDQPWNVRALIGALVGGFLFVVVPMALHWIDQKVANTEAPPEKTTQEAAPAVSPIPTDSSVANAPTDSPKPTIPQSLDVYRTINGQSVMAASPEDLVKIFDYRTSLQAEALASTYIGRWISVTGVVANVERAPAELVSD
ncbi:MAG: hypothetical protein WD036_00815 [Bauldia sp.]